MAICVAILDKMESSTASTGVNKATLNSNSNAGRDVKSTLVAKI